jgi:hypothetical protein
MQKRLFLLASLPLALGAVVAGSGACGNGNSGSPGGSTADASDANDDFVENTDANIDVSPMADAGGYVCWIPTSGDKTQGLTDPVLLCTQDQILGFVLQYAYVKGTGVMSTWSSVPPSYTMGTTHDWRDDLGLAAAIGDFHCSATYYGSTVDIAKYDSTLVDLHTVLPSELPKAMQSYDGALYYRMRSAALAFTYAMDSTDATTVNAAAESWAANVVTSFTTMVTPPASGGSGGDGGAGEGGASDAGDAGPSDGSAPPGPIALVGQPMGNGVVQYSPAQSIMAAAALLDMARVHANDPDGGAAVATWTATAQGTLAYVWNRARDPGTGLFYQTLVTSSDPGHDALAPGGMPTSDALLTDVQGAAILGFSRAMRALGASTIPDASAMQLPAPYAAWANQLVGAMTGLKLFTGQYPPTLCTTCGQGVEPTPTYAGAFLEGYVPSLGATIPNLTVAGNAYLLGGFGVTTALDATPVAGCQQDPNLNAVSCNFENQGIRMALDEYTQDPTSSTIPPAHSTFLTVVTDQNGDVIQQAFLPATSKDWGFAQTFPAAPGDAGASQEPGATDYTTAANLAMIEGLTQLWVTRPNPPACAY